MRFSPFFCLASFLILGMISPVRADDIAVQIEAARAAYGKGDPLHALAALQAATLQLNQTLVGQFGKLLPAAPHGWESSAPELQALDGAGGGLEVTEAYSKGEATLNVSLIIDNPAVASSVAMVQEASRQVLRPGWSKVKLGTDDAVLRFDPQTRAGEVVMVIGDRALLQIEGNDIARDDVLLEVARGWNVGALRKLIGVGS